MTWGWQPIGWDRLLVRGDTRLHQWWQGLTTDVPGAKFTPRYKKGRWDGRYTPGHLRPVRGGGGWVELSIGRGYLAHLLNRFPDDLPPPPPTPGRQYAQLQIEECGWPQVATLRDYQRNGCQLGLLAQWGRIALATNAGKGAMIALLAQWMATAVRGNCLVLCDERAVYDALHHELTTWIQVPIGQVKAGVTKPPTESVVLGMVPTLQARLRDEEKTPGAPPRWKAWLSGFSMVLADEADKSSSPGWGNVLAKCTHSEWRLGFSGTFPAEGSYEDCILTERLGPILLQVKNMELVEREISARPTVVLVAHNASHRLPPRAQLEPLDPLARRAVVFEKAILENEERHRLVAQLVRPGVPTAIVVNRIAHGEALLAEIPGAEFLDGACTETERIAALERFRTGAVPVVIVTKIFDRGTNRLGYAQDIIFASGEGSSRQTLQRIGRGLRRADGKQTLRLVDILDRGHFTLHRAAQRRVDLYNREGFAVEIYKPKPAGIRRPATT